MIVPKFRSLVGVEVRGVRVRFLSVHISVSDFSSNTFCTNAIIRVLHTFHVPYIYPRDAPRDDIFLTAAERLPRLIFGMSILSILSIFVYLVHLVYICLSYSHVSLYTPLDVSYLVLAFAFCVLV